MTVLTSNSALVAVFIFCFNSGKSLSTGDEITVTDDLENYISTAATANTVFITFCTKFSVKIS